MLCLGLVPLPGTDPKAELPAGLFLSLFLMYPRVPCGCILVVWGPLGKEGASAKPPREGPFGRLCPSPHVAVL